MAEGSKALLRARGASQGISQWFTSSWQDPKEKVLKKLSPFQSRPLPSFFPLPPGPRVLLFLWFYFPLNLPYSKIIPIPSPSSNSKLLYTEVTLLGLKWLEHPGMNGLTPLRDVCISEEVLEIEMYLINKGVYASCLQ